MTDKDKESALPILMAAQVRAELELTVPWALKYACHASVAEHVARLEHRIDLLRGTISGFATNGTRCGACDMSRELAANRLAEDERLAG